MNIFRHIVISTLNVHGILLSLLSSSYYCFSIGIHYTRMRVLLTDITIQNMIENSINFLIIYTIHALQFEPHSS